MYMYLGTMNTVEFYFFFVYSVFWLMVFNTTFNNISAYFDFQKKKKMYFD